MLALDIYIDNAPVLINQNPKILGVLFDIKPRIHTKNVKSKLLARRNVSKA